MTKMPYLNEPAVLWNLKARYLVDDIYTYTGSILIAINPFAALNHLYGKHMMEQYRGVALGDLSPHVYALSHEAFHCMQKEGKSQSILVMFKGLWLIWRKALHLVCAMSGVLPFLMMNPGIIRSVESLVQERQRPVS